MPTKPKMSTHQMVEVFNKRDNKIKFKGELIGKINGFYLILTQMAIGSALMGNREDVFSLLPFHEDEYVLTTVKEIPIGGLDKPD